MNSNITFCLVCFAESRTEFINKTSRTYFYRMNPKPQCPYIQVLIA